MPRVFSIETVTHGRYLVEASPDEARRPLLVGFHGYAENAERHLEQLCSIPGTNAWIVVAVQGLHRFYLRNQDIVASWMTREDRELAIADNVAYVDRVIAAVRRDYAATDGLVLAGFSQGVGMAFRSAVLGAARCDGVIALGGDIPPELRDGATSSGSGVRAANRFPPVLLGRGETDSWYTDEKLALDVKFLESTGVPLTVQRFAGGHEWTDDFRKSAAEFLRTRRA